MGGAVAGREDGIRPEVLRERGAAESANLNSDVCSDRNTDANRNADFDSHHHPNAYLDAKKGRTADLDRNRGLQQLANIVTTLDANLGVAIDLDAVHSAAPDHFDKFGRPYPETPDDGTYR